MKNVKEELLELVKNGDFIGVWFRNTTGCAKDGSDARYSIACSDPELAGIEFEFNTEKERDEAYVALMKELGIKIGKKMTFYYEAETDFGLFEGEQDGYTEDEVKEAVKAIYAAEQGDYPENIFVTVAIKK